MGTGREGGLRPGVSLNSHFPKPPHPPETAWPGPLGTPPARAGPSMAWRLGSSELRALGPATAVAHTGARAFTRCSLSFQPPTSILPGTRAVESGLWAALAGGEQPWGMDQSLASSARRPASPWQEALSPPRGADSSAPPGIAPGACLQTPAPSSTGYVPFSPNKSSWPCLQVSVWGQSGRCFPSWDVSLEDP